MRGRGELESLRGVLASLATPQVAVGGRSAMVAH
jgi:hypothetical protein